MKAVRIRYWMQDTLESGHWELTGLIPEHRLNEPVNLLESYRDRFGQVDVIDDDEEY